MRTRKVDYENLIAYQTWLPLNEWDFICVFTTNYCLSPKSARRLMDRLKSRLLKEFSLKNKELNIFWVAEEFKAKDGFHIHALIDFRNSNITVTTKDIDDAYQIVSAARKKGEIFRTDIQHYNKALLGARYCAKDLYKKTTAYDMI